jgi:ribosomal protein L11 methylase PrmA
VGALCAGGWLIVSGILDDELGLVDETLVGAGCTQVTVDADGEWRSALFRLHA